MPVSAGQLDYSTTENHNGFLSGAQVMAIAMSGQAGLEFEFECFMNFEAIGKLSRDPGPSPSRIEATTDVLSCVSGFIAGLDTNTITSGIESMRAIAVMVSKFYNAAYHGRRQLSL